MQASHSPKPFTALVGPDLPLALVFEAQRTILTTTDPDSHRLVLAFTAIDPLHAWERAGRAVEADPLVGFASPFLRTIPGTDAYVDDL